ncbi:hypothetical protein [Kitasatospora sp. NPDC057223]|uniref:hypothetical protein n=1 Tax=Kitasatospora sp. NPDC057223 TaxID=3346055 RepID=UPI0036302D22
MTVGSHESDDDLQPPHNEVPAPLPGLRFVARGPGVAVAVTQIRAHSTGREISVAVRFTLAHVQAELIGTGSRCGASS